MFVLFILLFLYSSAQTGICATKEEIVQVVPSSSQHLKEYANQYISAFLAQYDSKPRHEWPFRFDDVELLGHLRDIPVDDNDMSLNPVFEELERHFKSLPPKNILELGCGSGRLSFELLKRYSESSFITSDINEGVVKDLPKVERVTPFVFDATQEALSCFKGEKFDAIVSVGAVRYFKDQQHTRRLSKLLNPGGIVVLVDYEPFPEGQAVGLRNVPWLTAFYILRNHYKTDASFQVRVDTESSNYLNVLSKLAGSRMRQTYMMVLKASSEEIQDGAVKSC